MSQDNSFNQVALNPHHSVVIEACAGSGKTWLLVARIVRLLLADVKPQEILAITFTRKAAQEMSVRLNEWLQFLATAPDEACYHFLRERALIDSEIELLLPKARRLFEVCLTAQPGITINTFHGWFLQLLQRAPLTSGVSANFSLIEQTSLLIEEAWQEFARRLQKEEKYHHAFEFLLKKARDFNTKRLLLNFMGKRAEWWAYTKDQKDPVTYALSELERKLEFTPDLNVLEQLFRDDSFIAKLYEMSSALKSGTEVLEKIACEIENALDINKIDLTFSTLENLFFTGQGTPRKNLLNFFEKHSDKKNIYEILCQKLEDTRRALCNQSIVELNRAGLICGAELLAIYQKIKIERQVMDFSDVEWQAFKLLNDNEYAAYMLHKLDNRYRHILVDEFQDTNPLQWQTLLAWFNAYSPEEIRPIIFLVGDPKQSIYRFRRADARLFDIASEFLKIQYDARYLTQNVTRRSAPKIIETVNQLFSKEEKFAHFIPHISLHQNLRGAVEVLPLIKTVQAEQNVATSLRNPFLTPFAETVDSRRQEEAEQFASRIQDIVKHQSVIDGQGKARRAQYGDMMVLIRSRTHLIEYEMALRHAHIPYISTRQGGLLNTLEVNDLVALLEFLVTPFSDLKLAQALRSPIFSCTDEDLMALAGIDRGNWWQRLKHFVNQESASSNLNRAHQLLEDWITQVDTLPVHDLLDHIYHQSNLLARYQAAVDRVICAGVVANLQAFMRLALTLDSGRYPSLPRFISELANLRSASLQEAPDEGEIESADRLVNAVRLSTIHGTKGLESPIVWLLNTNHREARPESYDVILSWPAGFVKPTHFSLYSVKEERGIQRENYFEAEQEYANREDLNLLYVALTRTKQWLFISGCENNKSSESWYTKLQAVVKPVDMEVQNDIFIDNLAGPNPEKMVIKEALPIFNVSPVGKRDKVLNTSAQQRGILLHAMLEHVATLDYAHWKNKFPLSKADFKNLHFEVEKIISAPHLELFFNPKFYLHAWNEFSYSDQAGQIRRIDRLVEFENELWILDYKMGESALETHQASPYKKQLLEYSLATKSFFPNKIVRAGLIFSQGEFFEIDSH